MLIGLHHYKDTSLAEKELPTKAALSSCT